MVLWRFYSRSALASLKSRRPLSRLSHTGHAQAATTYPEPDTSLLLLFHALDICVPACGTRQALYLQVSFFFFPLTKGNSRLLLLYRASGRFSARCQQRPNSDEGYRHVGCVRGPTAGCWSWAMSSTFTRRSLNHV